MPKAPSNLTHEVYLEWIYPARSGCFDQQVARRDRICSLVSRSRTNCQGLYVQLVQRWQTDSSWLASLSEKPKTEAEELRCRQPQ